MNVPVDDNSVPDDDAIARELAELGEQPVDDDEVRFHRAGAEVGSDIDVATVATLMAIGHGERDARPLSQIEDRRTWNRVADRLESAGVVRLKRAVGSRSVWRSVVAGLAMAAGVALIPRIVPDGPAANSPAPQVDAEAIGDAARSGLEALGKDYDTDRAKGVLADYAARMQEENERR